MAFFTLNVHKIVEMKEDIAWNEYEKYLGQCIERGGSDAAVCLTVTWTGIHIGIFVLGTVVHADEAFIAQLGSEIKQQSCLTTCYLAVSAGCTWCGRKVMRLIFF